MAMKNIIGNIKVQSKKNNIDSVVRNKKNWNIGMFNRNLFVNSFHDKVENPNPID